MDFDVIIVRGSGNEVSLAGNISAMLTSRGITFEGIKSGHGLIYIVTCDSRALVAISKVPGVISCSPAVSVGSSVDEAAEFAADVAKNIAIVSKKPRHAGYAKLAPEDIGRVRGDAVFRAARKRIPDIELNGVKSRVHVELGCCGAYVYTDIVPGPPPA